MIRYVLMYIDKFSFSVDFMILDIKADPKMPLILGRPFIKIERMLVDIDKCEVKVIIKYHEICYKVIGIM